MPDLIDNLLKVLLQPQLRSVSLDFSRNLFDIALKSVAARLQNTTGRLERLSLNTSSVMDIGVQEILCQVMEANPGLREVTITDKGSVYGPIFKAASQLQHLTKLSLYSTRVRIDDPIITSPVIGFPALRTFKADIATRSIANLLESLKDAPLEELKLYCCCSRSTTAELGSGLQRIGNFKSLQIFDLYVEAPDPVWTGILLPLTSCPNLRTLSLRALRVFADVGDSKITILAKAFPLLESFELSQIEDDDEPQVPNATLPGLQPLFTHCPNLSILKIGIDARGLPDVAPSGVIGAGVKELDLSGSVADANEERIAEWICYLWPKLLQETGGRFGYGTESHWRKIWMEVNRRFGRAVNSW